MKPLAELLSQAGKGAVVTGGARGIGAAIALRLEEAGARVVRADLDSVDVAEASSVRALVERSLRELGSLDVWVNAAGIYPATPLLDLSDEEWERVLAVNLRGTFLCAREAARAMARAGRGGVILNVTSTAAYEAGRGVAHYVASKFGVRGLTKTLAVELGPLGIRVLAIAPTVTRTPGLEERREELERMGFALESLGPRLPLGRIAEPDDVALVAVFAASDLARFMTGSTLVVDGGELAG